MFTSYSQLTCSVETCCSGREWSVHCDSSVLLLRLVLEFNCVIFILLLLKLCSRLMLCWATQYLSQSSLLCSVLRQRDVAGSSVLFCNRVMLLESCDDTLIVSWERCASVMVEVYYALQLYPADFMMLKVIKWSWNGVPHLIKVLQYDELLIYGVEMLKWWFYDVEEIDQAAMMLKKPIKLLWYWRSESDQPQPTEDDLIQFIVVVVDSCWFGDSRCPMLGHEGCEKLGLKSR